MARIQHPSAALRPTLVKITGEVVDIRISPVTSYTTSTHFDHYAGAGGTHIGSHMHTHTYAHTKQTGAMTVRVAGKPVTCLIDIYTGNIGVMTGNSVTVWGRVRKWDPDESIPDSVDVDRMFCEETNEVHPLPIRGGAAALMMIPIVFVVLIMAFSFVMFSNVLGTAFPFFMSFPFMFFIVFSVVMIVFIVASAATRMRRFSPQQLERYVEIPSYVPESNTDAGEREASFAVSTCSNCGATVGTRTALFCPNCGSRLQKAQTVSKVPSAKCIVCNLPIKRSDAVVFCPFCGNRAHKIHMQEWLHTRNYCPACGKHLDEDSF